MTAAAHNFFRCLPALFALEVFGFGTGLVAADDPGRLFLSATIGTGGETTFKGVALRTGPAKEATVCFDTELLRMSAGWTHGFVSPVNLMSRGEYPTNQGPLTFLTRNRPGWEKGGALGSPRPQPFGPLPAGWAKYRGLYAWDDAVAISYTVGNCDVLETPEYDPAEKVFSRSFNLGKSAEPLALLVCELPARKGKKEFTERVGDGKLGHIVLESASDVIAAGVQGAPKEASWEIKDNHLYLKLPPFPQPVKFRVALWKGDREDGLDRFVEWFFKGPPFANPKLFTTGGALRWPETVTTKGEVAPDKAAYVVDTLTLPLKNPYGSEMLLGGFDFFTDGRRAAVCTFHGDVWMVSGIDEKLEKLTWKRFAAGLYHALGLRIVNDQIYVLGRDQITRLHDLNNDGEADFYENFNNDCQVTKNFHEFALDLQTDAAGNFYFAKAGPVKNGGRGFETIAEHHGAMFKVSPGGKKFEVIATGFRAPNGMGVGPNGELTAGDNEGTWTPTCRLNWVRPGGFYGVVDLAHRTPLPTDYDRPLCWLPKSVDNSPGSQVWVTTDKWGPFTGRLLHLSYGTCSLFHVLKEEVGGQAQGGVVRFPLNFSSGVMRARFNPRDHQLYVAGMKGWQTSAIQPGCLQRVRFTGQPVCLPLELRATTKGIRITFTEPLDAKAAADVENYSVAQWNYLWSASYGSPEISTKAAPPTPGEDGKEWSKDQKQQRVHDDMAIKSASLSADGRTVFLEIPDIGPVMQMQIKYRLATADGRPVNQEISNTVHRLTAE
ncbi:MAG: hypothetical protein HZA89_12670 [Verrucomicrobia bacterium]|nr:hypothetical protein [Verrucomicrobiota bacterium]